MTGIDAKSRWKDDSFLKSVQSMLSNEETDTSFFDAQTNTDLTMHFESGSQPIENNNSQQFAQQSSIFSQTQPTVSFSNSSPLFNPFFDSFDKIFSYSQTISSSTQPIDSISSANNNLSLINVQQITEQHPINSTTDVDPIEEKIRQIQLENERLRREIAEETISVSSKNQISPSVPKKTEDVLVNDFFLENTQSNGETLFSAKPQLATSDIVPIKTADVKSDILTENTRTDESQRFPTYFNDFSFESGDNFQNESVEFEADFSFFDLNANTDTKKPKQEPLRNSNIKANILNQNTNPFLRPKKANVVSNVAVSDRMNVNGPSLKMVTVSKNNGFPSNIGNSSSTSSISSIRSAKVNANSNRSLQTSMKTSEISTPQSSPTKSQSNGDISNRPRKLNRKRSTSLFSNLKKPNEKQHSVGATPPEKKHVTIVEKMGTDSKKDKEKGKEPKYFNLFRKRSVSTVEKKESPPIKSGNTNVLIDVSPENFSSNLNVIRYQNSNGFDSNRTILKPIKVRTKPLSPNEAAIIIQSSYRRHLVLRWFHPELMRSKVAHEFSSTEVYYVSSLNDVLRFFLTPLRKAAENGKPILSYEEIDELFSGIERIASFSQKNLSKIKQRIDNWRIGSLFGDLVLQMSNDMGDIYSEYIVGYEKMIKRFESMKTKSGVKSFFIRAEELFAAEQNHGHDITSFLILPVQRPPRYLLLLKEMLKWTHPSHKDYEILCSSAESLARIVSKADEDKGSFENDQKRIATLAEIAGNFTPKLKDFATEKGRRFIYQAKFFEIDFVENVIRDRVYLIFSDVLIFAKQNKKRLKVKTFVNLNLCSLKLIPSVTIKTTTYNHCLEFYTNVQIIVIGFLSEEEKMKFYDTCLSYSAMKRF